VAIALVKSIFSYAGRAYSDTELLDLAIIAETYNHGSPSGIDTLTITSGSPVWFEKEHSSSYLIKPKGEFHFIEEDSGRSGDIRSAIESVTNSLKTAPKKIQKKLNRIGELTNQTKNALEKAEKILLGQKLNEAQKDLESLGVSDAGLKLSIY